MTAALAPVVSVSARAQFRIRTATWAHKTSAGTTDGSLWLVGELDPQTRKLPAWTRGAQADVAVILLDATKGMTQQTRRHAYLVHLLQIPAVVFAVNKMDLVGHSRDVYSRHVREVRDWCRNLDSVSESMFVPVSALALV